ncbi:MAG: hypothetical protein ABI925_01355 [Verrucomicrobiota bacterium]
MSESPPIPPVGSEEPLPPKHSLPSYGEPTPEMHRKISREEEAELALKNTEFADGTRWLLIVLFLLTIATVPAIQFVAELRATGGSSRLPMFLVFESLPAWSRIHTVRGTRDLWNVLPRPAELKQAERTLENDSVVSQWLLPRAQFVLTAFLRDGNEQVYPGRDHWLFYRADVDHVTGPPFLDSFRMKRRAQIGGTQPDPIKAIIDFQKQLAIRGIDLVIIPIPVKPSIEGEKFSLMAPRDQALPNSSFLDFKARLTKAGIRLFDPTPLMIKRKILGGEPLYLESDTHWRPETMEFIAQDLAGFLKLPSAPERAPVVVEKEIVSRGDVAAMLKLSPGQSVYPEEKILIRQVLVGNALWRPNQHAEVLLLGDSFSNVFSVDAMGWGESAGFAEHLSLALGRPIDCILRNSDAAFATREILSNELARGRDRLAGKKLVIWEFAARELSFGNWKLLDLTLGQPRVSRFFTPNPGEEVVATGTVASISPAPRPGTVPYRDHIVALHFIDIASPAVAKSEQLQAVVYLWSMRGNVWTRAARLRPGDQVTLRLRRWSEVSDRYEKSNRTELDDSTLQLEEPLWGEFDSKTGQE